MTLYRNEEGDRVEAYRPGEMINPRNQYLFECLRQRALYPDQPLRKPTGGFLESLEPKREIKNLAEPVLKDIRKEFPLEKIEKRRELRTGAEIFKTGDTVEPAKKLAKMNGDEGKPARAAEVQNGLASTAGVRRRVGTVNPGRDFQDIIMEDADLFGSAAGQMSKVIRDLVFEAFSGQLYGKALDSLHVFRSWSVQFLEPSYYNEFLKRFKDELKTSNRTEFWDKIVEKKLGLISSEECSASGVSSENAEQFLSRIQEKMVPAAVDEPKEEGDLVFTILKTALGHP